MTGWPEDSHTRIAFRVITDPTVAAYGETVLVRWPDYRDGVSRIYFARSRDRGATWRTGATGKTLLRRHVPANFQHFHPQIVVNPDGVFACAFYEMGPKPTNTLIDVSDPKVTFIGDYFGFAGSERGFHPVWTDTRTGIQELWTDTLSA